MLNNAVLTGFMGSGKTTIGREVAKLCGSVLLDTDTILETNYNMTVRDFFASFGEERFREAEVFLCDWIKININNAIISTGGGLPARYDLRDIGRVFYLEAPLETLIQRIQEEDSKKRPLFDDLNSLKKLYKNRIPIYQNKSDYTLDALDSPENIALKIYDYMKGY